MTVSPCQRRVRFKKELEWLPVHESLPAPVRPCSVLQANLQLLKGRIKAATTKAITPYVIDSFAANPSSQNCTSVV